MDLLERASLLEELSGVLAATAAGGRVVLVAGEAGIGKSALVRRFTERQSADARFLLGVCDPLLTPRALGPLHPGPVTEQLGEAARQAGVYVAMSARSTAAPSTTRCCTSARTGDCSASTASSCRPTPSGWCGAWVTAPISRCTRPRWAGSGG
jgi:AAA ATPase domain